MKTAELNNGWARDKDAPNIISKKVNAFLVAPKLAPIHLGNGRLSLQTFEPTSPPRPTQPHPIGPQYDPHAEARRKSYEESVKVHHQKRMKELKQNPSAVASRKSMKSNSSSNFEVRRAAVLAKREAARLEKISRAKTNNQRVAARKARMEAMKVKEAVDVSQVGEGEVVEIGAAGKENMAKRSDPRTKDGAGSECATCRSTANLEEDFDNPGIWYCATCWNQWADES